MEVKVNTEQTVGDLIEYRKNNFLQVNHEYQRGLRWTDIQKRLFIDSIFRGYSIPAFYLHKVENSAGGHTNTYFDIVDGQQRIDAIFSFSEGSFPLLNPSSDKDFRFPNFVKDNACPWGGKRYEELTDELKDSLASHSVVIYEITTDNENEIRDLFIRLQSGTPLTPQDKRDSWPGNFTEFVLKVGGKTAVDKWYGYPLFKEVSKVNNESGRRTLVAQVFMLYSAVRNRKEFCDLKSSRLDQFYHENVSFNDKSKDTLRFEKLCDVLYQAFSGKPKVPGHHLIHLFLLVDALTEEYVDTWRPKLATSLHEFERRCHEASKAANKSAPDNEYERYWEQYARWTRTNSDIARTIQRRHAFFATEMVQLLGPLKQLDSRRSFSEFDRQIIFFRDGEQCQWCRMHSNDHKVKWEDSEVHHIVPHAKGGPTSTGNAALVHRDHHPKTQSDVDTFRTWWEEHPPIKVGASPGLPPDGTQARFEYKNKIFSGVIEDGRLVLTDDRGSFKSFSTASEALTNTSRNGWRDWQLQLPGSKDWTLAEDWRSKP